MALVLVKTFGCKVNYAESVSAIEHARELGIAILEYSEPALSPPQSPPLAVIVNSCCVTAEAERKALQFVRRIRRRWPESAVLLTGCGARHPLISERYTKAGAQALGDFTEVLGWLTARASRHGSQEHIPRESPVRSRAFIKVQDGCSCNCSYCVIPLVRPYYSRSLKAILAEVRKRVAEGYAELVLTGVNLGHYGRAPVLGPLTESVAGPDTADPVTATEGRIDLQHLVLATANLLPRGTRLRLSSIEPEDVTEEFLELFTHRRVCPHLHMPLQSGSDRVLAAMRRRYAVADYLALAERFRDVCPQGALTTDIMVGFPTETEEDFDATLAVCTAAGFERIHGFRFSARPGTAAAQLQPLPHSLTQERNRTLIEHCANIADARWQRHLSTVADVLVEKHHNGRPVGHGPAYQIVEVEADPRSAPRGRMVPVRLTSCRRGQFTGVIEPASVD